ncbi:MAG: hypothetical protein JO208_12105 [Alphaproteobacteria bacterium]|nr:hypothetical protein [Alphaproteobacteria bacterium]
MARKATPVKRKSQTKADDFESVAKRLGCDPDMDKFLKKLGKIARAKPKAIK